MTENITIGIIEAKDSTEMLCLNPFKHNVGTINDEKAQVTSPQYLHIFKSKSNFNAAKEKINEKTQIDNVVKIKDFKTNLMIMLFAFKLLILGIIKPPE